MPRPKPLFFWDTSSARYRRTDNGHYVRRLDVGRLFTEFIRGGEARAAALADRLVARDISLHEWQQALRDEMRHAHTVAAVTAMGGWEQMTPRDWGRLGALTRDQYGYLNVAAGELGSGARALNGRVRVSSRRYVRAARSTYYNTQHRMLVERAAALPGVLLARRVYGASITGEKCDGCQREHNRFWQAAETIAYIGSQECGGNCNCYLIYKTVPGLTEAGLIIGTDRGDDD
ncbi:MAG TPA: hypothetical protein VF668_01170 [Pyrinomonadaceae bacterium]|jgi:hypothetical protein